MTCIVGLIDRGTVYLGADSAGVGPQFFLIQRADRKLVRNGEFLIGFTSSFRMGQLLGCALNAPKPREGVDLFAYMVTDFTDAVRACLKNGGYAEKVNEGERGGEFLVSVRGRLFHIWGDYQVGESIHGFDAAGCGAEIALGSLHETGDLKPTDRLTRALTAAEKFSAGVRAPFFTEELTAGPTREHQP